MIRSLLTAVTILSAGGAVLAAQQPPAISLLPVQGRVSMLSAGDVNIAVQTGEDGVVLVDTPPAALVSATAAALRQLTSRTNIRYIINTRVSTEAVGGNAALVGPAAARGTGGAPFGFTGLNRPAIVAHENVLNRLSNGTPAVPAAMLPTTTYYLPSHDLFANDEAIVLTHAPAAHTDSDSLVFFRRSDVLVTGAIFTPGRYPEIDVERGGTVHGLVRALGKVLEIAVSKAFSEGGTQIVPARGRVAEETDVAEYRDMVAIIRDRVQDAIRKRQTLEQVKAARPSRDYDAEYNAGQADADRFVESIYRTLTPPPSAATGGRGERP